MENEEIVERGYDRIAAKKRVRPRKLNTHLLREALKKQGLKI